MIPDLDLRANILKRHERMMERRVLAKMTPQEKENYMKQKVGTLLLWCHVRYSQTFKVIKEFSLPLVAVYL